MSVFQPIQLHVLGCIYFNRITDCIENSVDPDQMASSLEAIWSGFTLFSKVEIYRTSRFTFFSAIDVIGWCIFKARLQICDVMTQHATFFLAVMKQCFGAFMLHVIYILNLYFHGQNHWLSIDVIYSQTRNRVPTSSENLGKPGKSQKRFHAWKNHGI